MSFEDSCHTVPSPLAGEGQGGGWQQRTQREPKSVPKLNAWESEELLLPCLRFETGAAPAVPLSLSLPRKGGGNDVALLCPTIASICVAPSRGRTEREPIARKLSHCLFLAVISVIADMVSFESGSSIGSPRAAERSAAR
jgi:hypothetical protein